MRGNSIFHPMYGPHFFPSDAADSADTPRAPGYSSEGTLRCEDKGPCFAYYSKYLNSDILFKNFHVFNFRGSRIPKIFLTLKIFQITV